MLQTAKGNLWRGKILKKNILGRCCGASRELLCTACLRAVDCFALEPLAKAQRQLQETEYDLFYRIHANAPLAQRGQTKLFSVGGLAVGFIQRP